MYTSKNGRRIKVPIKLGFDSPMKTMHDNTLDSTLNDIKAPEMSHSEYIEIPQNSMYVKYLLLINF